ncbi:capsule assembly Wzi family protein [Algoriphagus sp. AGSA1]|nr:capsule assembly Wzi family protein [Algoriphagus sp. AGSA1]
MKTRKLLNKGFGACLLLVLLSHYASTQTVPVGTPVLDDYLRRAQLLGDIDSASSFMIRPLYPASAFGIKYGFDLDSSVVDMDLSTVHTRFGKDNKGTFLMMPAVVKLQYNSTYAFGVNDGAFIPNRGIQTILSPGAYMEYGGLSVQFQPELLVAQNQDYLGFPLEHQLSILYYYDYMNRIDMPEQFGKGTYVQAYLGQSSIRYNFKEYSVGVSSENLWWGPGRRNSLLLGNNAPGFLHFTANTRKPVKTTIGAFEGQMIGGFLKSSGYLPPWPDYRIQENSVLIPKPENSERFLSGLIFTYQPKWVPGLFLGYASTSQVYQHDISTLGDILPVFNGRKKAQNIVDPIEEKRQQFSSGFFRWLSPEGHFEFYGEYGTRGNDRKLNDFMLTPESGRAFTFGFSHLMSLKKPGHYFQVSSEMTQTGQTIREDIRNLDTWYIHGHVVDGYTHNGQVLGAGNGPGSNVIFVELAWVNKMNRIGFQMERIVYNNDYYYYRYEASKDWRNKYVDLVPSLIGDWKVGDVLLNARLQYVNTLNYKWYLENNPDQYFVPGYDRKNFVGQVGLTYIFQ